MFPTSVRDQRDKLRDYLVSDVGEVPRQDGIVTRGTLPSLPLIGNPAGVLLSNFFAILYNNIFDYMFRSIFHQDFMQD